MAVCDRCDGDGKAHGSDRPFEWSGPGTWPGPCPKCKGTGDENTRFRTTVDSPQECTIEAANPARSMSASGEVSGNPTAG